MQKLRGLHHHRGQAVIDELNVERMEGVERRSHAGEDNCLELALLEAGCELIERLRDLQSSQRFVECARLIEDIAKVGAVDYGEIRLHGSPPPGRSDSARLWRRQSGLSLRPARLAPTRSFRRGRSGNWRQ